MKLSYKYRTFDVTVAMLRHIKRRMRWVRAAGCVVSDDEGNRLLICRNGRWDLPKGKVEQGETLAQAALRETLEETGVAAHLTDVSGVTAAHPPLPVKTYHVYNLYGGWHLKQTSWFAARAAGVRPQGIPQYEEGITDIVWVTPYEWQRRLSTSYGTLKTLSRRWNY